MTDATLPVNSLDGAAVSSPISFCRDNPTGVPVEHFGVVDGDGMVGVLQYPCIASQRLVHILTKPKQLALFHVLLVEEGVGHGDHTDFSIDLYHHRFTVMRARPPRT